MSLYLNHKCVACAESVRQPSSSPPPLHQHSPPCPLLSLALLCPCSPSTGASTSACTPCALTCQLPVRVLPRMACVDAAGQEQTRRQRLLRRSGVAPQCPPPGGGGGGVAAAREEAAVVAAAAAQHLLTGLAGKHLGEVKAGRDGGGEDM